MLIAEGVCDADHTFIITSTATLTDDAHTVSAVARLGEQTSLPSAPLYLDVDPSLDYDPAGILIAYEYHNAKYLQTLRDETGCAAAGGGVDTLIQFRPGSVVTVTIPIRRSFYEPAAASPGEAMPASAPPALLPASQYLPAALIDYQITNWSNKPIKEVYLVPGDSQGGLGDEYRRSLAMNPGDTRTIQVEEGRYNMVYVNTDGSIGKFSTDKYIFSGNNSETIEDQPAGTLSIENELGDKKIVKVMLAQPPGPFAGEDPDQLGVNVLKPGTTALNPGEVLSWQAPEGPYNLLIQREDGTWHFVRSTEVVQDHPYKLKVTHGGPGREINIYSSKEICGLYIVRADDAASTSSWGQNLVKLLGVDRIDPYTPYKISVAYDTYHLKAVGCDGTFNETRYNIKPVASYLWDIGDPCAPPGEMSIGDFVKSIFYLGPERPPVGIPVPGVDWLVYQAHQTLPDGWIDTPYWIHLELCNQLVRNNLSLGQGLIDPDGYVYDASLGLDHKIEGATVTCDVFDEDYQTWNTWPAALYENQINPQLTGMEGYYAFFVPPGLYRVWAAAPGYQPHTSPDIRVISEIVHYNIPLIPDLRYLFLPALHR